MVFDDIFKNHLGFLSHSYNCTGKLQLSRVSILRQLRDPGGAQNIIMQY